MGGKRPSDDKVGVARGPWKIWLDTYTVHAGNASQTYTRCRAYFAGWHELKVTVRPRNAFDRALQAFGYGSRSPAPRALLKTHVVKGKPESRLRSFFMASAFLAAVKDAPRGTLRVRRASRGLRKRYGEDLGVVVYRKAGVERDVNGLAATVGVVGEALEALAAISEARRERVSHRP